MESRSATAAMWPVAAPILSQGDLLGCVMLLLGEDQQPLQEADQRLAQTVAGFLGKQMES